MRMRLSAYCETRQSLGVARMIFFVVNRRGLVVVMQNSGHLAEGAAIGENEKNCANRH